MEPTSSPTPVKVNQYVDFYAALRAAVEGKQITKAEWGSSELYGYFDKEILKINLKDGIHDWILSEADVIGTDWQVL